MNIVVLVKPVPNPETYNKISIDPVTKLLNREGVNTIVNPADKNALEMALQIKEKISSKVIVISMASESCKDRIRECLAMGADEAYILSDKGFVGSDTFSTSYTLAKGIEKIGIEADLILSGNESTDGATSQVPSQVGEWLELPHISNIIDVSIMNDKAIVKKRVEEGIISYEVQLPALLAVAKNANQPRLITAMGIIKSQNKKLTIFSKTDLDINEDMIGLHGSPTKLGDLLTYDISRKTKQINGNLNDIAEQVISVLKNSGIKL